MCLSSKDSKKLVGGALGLAIGGPLGLAAGYLGGEVLGSLTPKIPNPAAPPKPPQQAKMPNTAPLQRRSSGGIAIPSGSTLLSGPSGISAGQLNLGTGTLLGGGG